MIRAYKQQQRKTDGNTWTSGQENASRSEICAIIVEGGVAASLKWAKKLVLFSEACYFCADFGLNIQATTSLAPQMQECPELAFDKHWKSELSWNEFINDILSVMTLPRIVC